LRCGGEAGARNERSESSARPQRKATGGGCGGGGRRREDTAKASEAAGAREEEEQAAVGGRGGGCGDGWGVGAARLGLVVGTAVGGKIIVVVAVLGVVEWHCVVGSRRS
jgi:hypothetical protein